MTTLLECPAEAPPRLRWSPSLMLHTVPAAMTLGGAVLIAPLLRRAGWPEWCALTLAGTLLVIPIQLGILVRAAYRLTGRWSFAGLSLVLACRERSAYVLVTPALALAGTLLLELNSSAPVASVYPTEFLSSTDITATIVVGIMLVTLVIDGLVNPIVEESYRRAAPMGSLDSVRRYWQPENVLFILLVQAVITYAAVQAGSVTIRSMVNTVVWLLG